MTSQPPVDELSDDEYQQLLRREREKLDALRMGQNANGKPNAGGKQFRLASLLIGVTLAAGLFAWVRRWSAEELLQRGLLAAVMLGFLGLPIAAVRTVRSRFLRRRSYLWTVLVAQLVLPMMFGLAVNFVNYSPTWRSVAAVSLCFFTVTASSVLLAWIPVAGLLKRGDERRKAMLLGALWPLVAPLAFVLYRAALGDDRFSDISSAVAFIFEFAIYAFPLTAVVIGVSVMISRWAIDLRQTDGPLWY